MRRLAFIMLLSLLLFVSCATSGTLKPYRGRLLSAGIAASPAIYSVYYEDKNIIVEGKTEDRCLALAVYNRTDKSIYVDFSESFAVSDGAEVRISDNSADISINAKASNDYSIKRADSILITDSDKLHLAYRIAGETYYAELSVVKEKDAIAEIKPVYQDKGEDCLGKVFIEKSVWHFLFTNRITEDQIERWLLEEAWHRYGYLGKKLDVYNISYSTTWSAWSLVLYYDIIGYVDKLEASADVYISE